MRVDQGSNFVTKHFKENTEAEGITLLEAPIKSPATMSHVERYRTPLRSAFNKIRDSLPRTESDVECLQMATRAVNDNIGPEGLCPRLLVYGTIPKPPRVGRTESQIRRARALGDAFKAVQKEQAKRKIAFELRHPGGPKAKDQEEELAKLPSGPPVMVYREKNKIREVPYPLVNLDGKTVVVRLPRGRKIFRSTVVKSGKGVAGKENGVVRYLVIWNQWLISFQTMMEAEQ